MRVTEWREDDQMMAGDASHEGDSSVRRLLADEYAEKVDSDTWQENAIAEGFLPFEFETQSADEDEAVDEAMQAFAAEICEYDYLQPDEVDYYVVEENCAQ